MQAFSNIEIAPFLRTIPFAFSFFVGVSLNSIILAPYY